MNGPYHNTNALTGEALKNAVASAKKCDEAVFVIFLNTRKRFTGGDIFQLTSRAGLRYPITSIRRSMTNLMNDGQLIKTSEKKLSVLEGEEHFYIINHVKYPSQTDVKQAELFG
jgi:hypothetical protein